MDKEEVELGIIYDKLEECDNYNCCEYGETNECYNAAHRFCKIYEIWNKTGKDGIERMF